ncbi:protein N-terminal asparagine amidohydrolase [Plodia interpunctella]|uniref:protein N-terminal asparagine amidohydrolase n=1 Tax=Plodia interpunctella TaxID=58824 RepID=UPI0023686418|nr:protein N-terminal asparagine amidohydrolase [Plodia interpunctella]XP_053606305.1 protein N-terminal asparagine amidohydrolase [Plodia interpunctella]XP_053606306.1 protein N-terminal asparagine amidohydrolase [Plodia interpunctella]XP_053606307.1 protein N-terminal asparagine amidohydrolase [Plodia interpunctella]XP_053606308.1 protein N-terminal asparagine amidohydrolase [Plodia interpunctella]XP_053606309.1 protein N-terminal asparagine amidohydrolase [Plodia interpunctella]XP_05360631
MVVVLNGVLADECPTTVRALLAAHPGYRDAAAQLLGAAARVVGPQGLLYVGQRELAAVVPHDKNVNIIGSDDATSCIIVIVRHSGSGAVALAHLDGSGTAEAASTMVSRVQQLAVGYPEGRLELQLVGGFTDPHRYSDELFASIMLSFHRLSVEIDLTLACCCELNTALEGGAASPLTAGAALDVRSGELFPAAFPDKGPELALRGARMITGGPHSAQVLDIYDNAVGMLRIGPFNYDPLRGVDLWLEQSDDFILQHLSTTPNVEPPHFVHNIRLTLKFIQQHPFPAVTVFPDNRPHYYRRDDHAGCWLPVRF